MPASTASFFTRPAAIALVARGWAMWASTPASARRSANQLQPYVASKATETGSGSSSPKTRRKADRSFAKRRLNTTSPASSRATAWLTFR